MNKNAMYNFLIIQYFQFMIFTTRTVESRILRPWIVDSESWIIYWTRSGYCHWPTRSGPVVAIQPLPPVPHVATSGPPKTGYLGCHVMRGRIQDFLVGPHNSVLLGQASYELLFSARFPRTCSLLKLNILYYIHVTYCILLLYIDNCNTIISTIQFSLKSVPSNFVQIFCGQNVFDGPASGDDLWATRGGG